MKTNIIKASSLAIGLFSIIGTAAAKAQNSSRMSGSQNSTSTLSAQDRMFLRKAAIGGLTEVKEGQLAGTNSSTSGVNDFGQRMVTDHTQANDQLKDLATQKNFTLPTEPDAKHQKTLNLLTNLKGSTFDRKYISGEVKDHQETIALFEREANRGSDPDVKAFASKTLPTLREHLAMVESLRGSGKMRAHRNMGGSGM